MCERSKDCWEVAVEDFICQKHKDEDKEQERKSRLCIFSGCEQPRNGGGTWLCEEHYQEDRKKRDAKIKCIGCSHEVSVVGTRCPDCQLRFEHTPDGWRKDQYGLWKCIPHGCYRYGGCDIHSCDENANHLVEGKLYCDWHKEKLVHDKTCNGNKDNHKGCRGPVPLNCQLCLEASKVKFLNNSKQWLCAKCLPLREALFKENGRPNKCSYCPQPAAKLGSDLKPYCEKHA
jgi:hypothetical protein